MRRNKIKKKRFAERLRKKLPDSEKWFWNEWTRIGMKHEFDESNQIFCGFIPDVVNHRYKYVIEIDGSIHLKKFMKKKDKIKNLVYEKNKYSVFRIEAYNYDHLGMLAGMIEKERKQKDDK